MVTVPSTSTAQQPSAAPASRRVGPSVVGEWLLIVAFLLAISLPWPGMYLLHRTTSIAKTNERVMAHPPAPRSFLAVLNYPFAYRDYFVVNYAGRRQLITAHGLWKVQGLHVSPSAKVVLGPDGWMFFNDPTHYRRDILPFTPPELERWRTVYEKRRDWLAARGIRYLVVIPPEKFTLYQEYVPVGYGLIHRPSRLDQFVAYMDAHSTVEILDLRPALRAKKGEYLLYRKTDAHWNQLGGYVGYCAVIERLRKWYPALQPMPIEHFTIVQRPIGNGDATVALGLGERITEPIPCLEPHTPYRARFDGGISSSVYNDTRIVRDFMISHCPHADIPRAVILRDSFMYALMPFLSEHIGRAVYRWEFYFDPATIEREHPDIVIQERMERALLTGDPRTGLPMEQSSSPTGAASPAASRGRAMEK